MWRAEIAHNAIVEQMNLLNKKGDLEWGAEVRYGGKRRVSA